MKKETVYSKSDLVKGKCKSCGEKSDEIYQTDGRCVDCIYDEDFHSNGA